jgi:YkoY family integral membrane protein
MLNFTLSDVPLITWYIGVLAFLEGLLSADNALVLALMVRHLPKREQRRVLVYGIWGAIGFRIIAVLLSAILLRFWIFKVVGGLYLLYLAIAHFLSSQEAAASPEAADGTATAGARSGLRGFWGTVTSVTLADIAFSIDSILAAVAMADDFPKRYGDNGKVFIVVVGGILGIITMRFVVRYFLILLDRFPGLAEGAYALVAWIGLKLTISGFLDAMFPGRHFPEWLFWSGMFLIAALSMVIKPRLKPTAEPGVSESLEFLESVDAADGAGPEDGEVGEGEQDARGPEDGKAGADGPDLLGSGPDRERSAEQTGRGRAP